jgi:GNAT superfamily N-acetyltransferase
MDEKLIDQLYSEALNRGYKKGKNEFVSLMKSDDMAYEDMFSYAQSKGLVSDATQFGSMVGRFQAPYKKKEEPTTVGLPQEMVQFPQQKAPEVQPRTSPTPVGRGAQRQQAMERAAMALPSVDGLSVSAETEPIIKPSVGIISESTAVPKVDVKAIRKQKEFGDRESYWDNVIKNVIPSMATSFDKIVASIPETAINILATPGNAVAYLTGLDIATNADKIKEQFGIRNPVLDWLNEEQSAARERISKFNKENYSTSSIAENIAKGNYGDAFELLGAGIIESLPVSLAMMYGGATLTPAQLAGVGTFGFYGENAKELGEEDPNMPEIEKNLKALGMASAETVFSAIGTGTIGQVYRDLVKKEGADVAKDVLQSGLAQTYKKAIEKYGVPVGLVGEGIEEAATQITQNVISGKSPFQGAADAFILGAGSGAAFTAPISGIKAANYVSDRIEKYDTKVKIEKLVKEKGTTLDKVFNVPVADDITVDQVEIANMGKSRDLLLKDLEVKMKNGDITEDDAKQSLYVFDKVQQVSSAVKDLDVTAEEKATIASLLKKRDDIRVKMQNKDDVLLGREKQQIADINNQINEIILKPKEDAVQEQAAGEVPIQPTTRVSEQVAEGEPQAEPQGVTAEGVQETVTATLTQEEVKSLNKEDVIKLAKLSGVEANWDMVGEGDFLAEKSGVDAYTQRMLPSWNRASKSGEINPDSKLTYDIVRGRFGGLDQKETVTAKDENGVEVAVIKMAPNGGIEHLAVAPEFRGKGVSEQLYKVLKENNPNVDLSKTKNRSIGFEKSLGNIAIVEAYNKAKADGSNPELVQAVESAIGKAAPEVSLKTQEAQLQLETSEQRSMPNEKMIQQATDEMSKMEDEGFSQQAFDATNPEPEVEVIPIQVTENTELANKVEKMGLSQLIGKKINLVMADQLKVGPVKAGKKILQRMGGPLFPLIDGLFGKVAWASMNNSAASAIINGALKSDYTVVYNMNPSAIDSNVAMAQTFIEDVKGLGKEKQQDVFNKVVAQLDGKKFGAKTDQVNQIVSSSKNLTQLMDAISGLDVDTKAKVINLILPSQNVKASTEIGKTLQAEGITIESVRAKNVEQFASNLPAGALTMVLEVQDKNGNKITEATKDEAIITPEQQVAEGLPQHENYPVYIRGKAVAMLNETTPFWNVVKDSLNNINVKVAQVIKQASGRPFTSKEARSAEMRAASMTANKPRTVMAPTPSMYDKFVALLSRSFPSVEIVKTQEEFDKLLANLNGKKLATKNQNVYGAVYNGKLYLNPSLENYNTPVHEFGHIWLNVAKEAGVELYNKGISLIQGSPYIDQVLNSPEYKRVIEQMKKDGATQEEIDSYVQEEALATAIGDKGESFVIAAQRKSFKEWLNTLYSFVRNLTGISEYSAEQLEDITLDEFLQAVSADLLSGRKLFEGAEAKSKEGVAQLSTREEGGPETIPGYDRMMDEVDGIIEKSEKRGVRYNKIMDNVMEYVMGSKVYEDANDVQREALVRQVRKMFEKKEKRAPSAKKVLGQKKTEVVVKDDLAALNDQIRLEARAARESKQDINAKRKQLTEAVRKMAEGGKLSAKKVAAIINKIGKLNLDNSVAVNKFIDYASKVFADADYADKLSTANSTRKKIRKISKNADKSANLRTLGSKFAEIDPSMVDDIDTYNEIAASILESVKGSTIRGTEVKFAGIVKEADAIEYINQTLKEQQQKMFDEKVESIKELFGVDASNLTQEQLNEFADLISGIEPVTKYNDTIIRDAIRKAFDTYSTLIKDMLNTGKDPFTDEDVEFTDSQRKTIQAFMNMNLDLLDSREALDAVDGLLNFIQNKSTAKMESVVSRYTGEKNARDMAKKGVRASKLKKYWSPAIGRFLAEQTTNLNILFEKMFKGFNVGGMVESMMGVSALKNGKSRGQSEANRIVNDYVKQFYEKKANGEKFNTGYNAIERGMASFMTRNVVGTQDEITAEFNRRKGLIEQSIEALAQGNEAEVEKSKLYQQAYDKILADSKTIDEVSDKVDPVNMEAVNFWRDQWASKYDQLADVSLNVYNKVLDKDTNYVPDKFTRVSSDTGDVDLSTDDMAFHVNNGTIYKKETGVLMSATRPDNLPVNPKNNDVSMYIDLSFDKNMANSMYDALVDINTAGAIRQVEAFMNSSSFKKIVPQSEDAKILKDRINLFVRNIRNKNPYDSDELSSAVRKLNKIATIGVGQALGGILQPVKQVIPVAMNTLINGGGLDLGAVFNTAKNNFISNSGYAIANRGVESQAQVESLNKLIDEAAKSKGEKAIKLIEQANKKWLEIFLVKPDVFIARASWMTYYEQALKKQGIDPKTVDYNTHQLNEEAADYAQRMVDRQQNVSDTDLAGKLLADKDPTKEVFIKMLMPFASFRMNQSARLGSDLGVLTSSTSTVEDKKVAARSLAGFGVEMATFKIVSAGAAILMYNIVSSIMGDDDEEDKKKAIDAIVKGQLTSTVTDVFSPLPLVDKLVQAGAAAGIDKVQDAMGIPDDEKLSIYSGTKQEFVQSLGLFGIAADRASQLYELSELAYNGKFTDEYGRDKKITDENMNTLKYLIGPAILTNIGLAPTEVNTIVRNSIKTAKRNAAVPINSSDRMKKILLQGYKTREEMRRYDPDLYEKTFGKEGLEKYVLPTEVIKREMNKEMRDVERDMKDRIYNYTPKKKGKGFGSEEFGEEEEKPRKKKEGGFGSGKFGE